MATELAVVVIGGLLTSSNIDPAGYTSDLQSVWWSAPDIVILAISVSVFIGLVPGIYPAMRAARLNPIDALRYR